MLLPSALAAMLWMRDLFLQCMYVRVCHAQECQFGLTCTDTREYYWMSSLAMEDREKQRFLTMEDGYDTMRLVLHNVHVLQSWVLNAADSWQHTTSHFYHSVGLHSLCTQSSNMAWILFISFYSTDLEKARWVGVCPCRVMMRFWSIGGGMGIDSQFL